MSKIDVSDNAFDDKYNNFFTGLYNRNKKFLAIAAALFFGSLFIGLFTGYFSPEFTGHFLTAYINQLVGLHIEKTTLFIFLHNLQAVLVMYLGGAIGIIPVGELFANGFIYGSFVGYLAHGGIISHFLIKTPGNLVIYTLPHGIFEISGFIISGAAGFRLTSLIIGIIKSKRKNAPVIDHYWKLKDSLALFAVAVVLIFIAAIIEANFSVSIGNYITGSNII